MSFTFFSLGRCKFYRFVFIIIINNDFCSNNNNNNKYSMWCAVDITCTNNCWKQHEYARARLQTTAERLPPQSFSVAKRAAHSRNQANPPDRMQFFRYPQVPRFDDVRFASEKLHKVDFPTCILNQSYYIISLYVYYNLLNIGYTIHFSPFFHF